MGRATVSVYPRVFLFRYFSNLFTDGDREGCDVIEPVRVLWQNDRNFIVSDIKSIGNTITVRVFATIRRNNGAIPDAIIVKIKIDRPTAEWHFAIIPDAITVGVFPFVA